MDSREPGRVPHNTPLWPRRPPMKLPAVLTLVLPAALGPVVPAMGQTTAPAAGAQPAEAACPPLLRHTFPRLQDEKPQSLCQYRGKVLLVVNTASFCGFTPQYEGLEKLHARYKD